MSEKRVDLRGVKDRISCVFGVLSNSDIQALDIQRQFWLGYSRGLYELGYYNDSRVIDAHVNRLYEQRKEEL